MKKNFIRIVLLIAVIWLIFFIKDIPKYRFGYFVEGPELKYEHRDADVLKLENGNVLILGQNAHSCPTQESCKDDIMPVVEVPSEIYNVKTNKIEELRLPNNIRYQAKGILLKNNKLLLTYAYDSSDNSYPKIKKVGEDIKDIKPPYLYDSMAIVNLDTVKVERIIKKQINKIKSYNPNWYFGEKFIFLNNSDVLMIDFNNTVAEVFDIQKINSKLLNIEIPTSIYSTVIAKDKNKVLIFGENNLKKEAEQNAQLNNMDNVYEYNVTTEKLKPVGEVLRRNKTTIKRINKDEIMIMGGETDAPEQEFNVRNIEIYNISKNTSEIVGKLIKTHATHRTHTDKIVFEKINNKYILIVGGHKPNYSFDAFLITTEIFDLENNKTYIGPNMLYYPVAVKGIKLIDGSILFIQQGLNTSRRLQIFKKRIRK